MPLPRTLLELQEEVAALLARLKEVIDDSQALQADIMKRNSVRHTADQAIPQAIGKPKTNSGR